ncbi:ABC transporter permease [Paenibacillus selenitireducens]|uniref:Transport permease protein n=1 Tax=Paenibacillus selenitireducens TaxID=1324314 RepID=A0A1T2XAD2_9BACL|nr:ABC transporter permease [Paenibacillus selenitireducens]OPA76851.1 ABC transporter permease [Paenibacillus selenitireducens]
MRAYGQLTIAQLRLFGRNRQVLFFTLFFPVFFMVMFGYLFSNSGGNTIYGGLIDLDQTTESRAFIAALDEQKEILKLDTSEGQEAAMEKLRQGDNQMVIIIPKGYGEKLQAATSQTGTAPPGTVDVFYDETQAQKAGTALNAVSQVVDGISKSIAKYSPVVTITPKGIESLNLKYIDFLVPGIVAMMIMSNNLNGVAAQIASWRERGVLRRMQSTPLKSSTFIAAQITARLILNGAQALIVLLIGSFVFGTQMNGSWALLLAFVIVGTLAFMAIGFIIAGLAKTPESAGPIAGFISFPLMFLGGVFFPIQSMPSFLQPIIKALPIAHLSTALRQIMNVGAGLSQLWSEGLMLCAWMIVAFIVASFTFKWE